MAGPPAHSEGGKPASTAPAAADTKRQGTPAALGIKDALGFLLCFLICRWAQVKYLGDSSRQLTLTTYKTQPLAVRKPEFLNDKKAAMLLECAHTVLRNAKSGAAAPGTTAGRVLKFNTAGVPQLRAHPSYACLASYFDALKDERGGNAFVLSVVQVESGWRLDHGSRTPAHDSDECLPPMACGAQDGRASISWHADQESGIWSNSPHFAHATHVWYAAVPPDMEGGKLELQLFGLQDGMSDDEVRVARRAGAIQADEVTPERNMLVTFRGDAFHRVMPYQTSSPTVRVSLVLEEYRIAEDEMWKTVTFAENDVPYELRKGSW